VCVDGGGWGGGGDGPFAHGIGQPIASVRGSASA
jgi:hypothetical protein